MQEKVSLRSQAEGRDAEAAFLRSLTVGLDEQQTSADIHPVGVEKKWPLALSIPVILGLGLLSWALVFLMARGVMGLFSALTS